MSGAVIRQVREEDFAGILRIYEPYVRETAITFEYEVPSPEEFARRIRTFSSRYPYLVCLLDGDLAGYAYAHRQLERAAYQWNAELSVYVERSRHRLGIGRALYSALMEILALQGVRNVCGLVTAPNRNSEALHEALGFARAGTWHRTGYKMGAWRDVALFEKTIGGYGDPPAPVVPVGELPAEAVGRILARYGTAIKISAE